MMSHSIRAGLAGLLGLGIAGCLSASVMVTVAGNQDIFLAGQTSSPSTDAGALPTAGVSGGFSPVAGATYALQVFGVTGSVSACIFSPGCPSGGADGVVTTPTPATEVTGPPAGMTSTISPIQFSSEAMFLVGVFLNGTTLPATQVASMGNYGGGGSLSSSLTTYSPLLGQGFFIGDGLTGTGNGSMQNFIVPTGATQIYFGFVDSTNNFVGPASSFGDDGGSLAVNLQIVPIDPDPAVPEPGTIVLFALGVAGLAIGSRKRLA
jgi:hypothetical protein